MINCNLIEFLFKGGFHIRLKRNSLIILSLVVLILFMGMASASSDLDDHNDTLTVSNEIEIVDDNNENLDNGNADMLGASSQENDILKAEIEFSGTTLSELRSAISSASVGDTIILQNDITASSNSEITSYKSVTIDGNGHTIDANGKYRIFDSTNTNLIVFKNINFINSTHNDNGIMNFWYGPVEFINCTFNNTGPLSLLRAADSRIINCTFERCSGSDYSGAIYGQVDYTNNITIQGCTFKKCTGSSGAIIYGFKNNVVIDNCTFIDNRAHDIITTKDGCIIGNITKCLFENNVATGFYIAGVRLGIVDNCTFINNTIPKGVGGNNGGALFIANGNVTNSKFIRNNLSGTEYWGHGVILFADSVECFVVNCTFEDNIGSEIRNYVGTVHVYNNTFNSTNAVVFNSKNMYLENNTVKNYIVHNGLILSEVYFVAMANQTIYMSQGYSKVLNGTITDDMGNTIILEYNVIGIQGRASYTFTVTDKTGRQVYTFTVSQSNYENYYDKDTGVFKSDRYTFNNDGVYTVTPSFTNYNNRGFSDISAKTGAIIIRSTANMVVSHNETIYVGENATVKVTVDDTARGNITITVGNQNKTFVLSDTVHGIVEWNVTGLPAGTYPVIVNYTGDAVFGAENYQGVLNVKNYDTIILITPEHGTYGQVVNATATLYYAKGSTIVGPIDDNLTVVINNKVYNVRSGEKIMVTERLPVNPYEVVAIYNGSSKYKAAINNTNLYVTKATPFVEIETLTQSYEDRLGIRVRTNDTATGYVALKVNGEVIDVISLKSVDEYGYLTKFIENVKPGIYNIEAEYLGDENYTNSSNKTSFSNIKGTYTDLQRLINENTILDLEYDFIYTPEIDKNYYPNGVKINKTITINGNGHNISGNNTYPIFIVNETNVHLDNINFTNAKGTSTIFWNNTLGNISNSRFTDNDVDYDIYNNQTLNLKNNTLSKFIYNDGEILSKTNIWVLDNKTVTTTKNTNIDLNAIIKDDNNNTIISKTKLQFILLRNVKNIIH